MLMKNYNYERNCINNGISFEAVIPWDGLIREREQISVPLYSLNLDEK